MCGGVGEIGRGLTEGRVSTLLVTNVKTRGRRRKEPGRLLGRKELFFLMPCQPG